ncbi:thiamine biosynthesis protein ThiI [Escherichia coli]|uniref:Thiamine biosynthesis protein ThiI n=1 Tax=Escherichia coli TaxID=562 RepID=A0A376U414_ECOLX|nr:thiamine biosynthesis protein ThiI [Escherichia coli]
MASAPNDVILDIRSIDEQEDKPLKVEGIDVVFSAVL